MEERTLANNERSRTVTVLDAQINALYVEGYPRWESLPEKTNCSAKPTVNISTLLLTADEGFVQDADPAVIDKTTGQETFPRPPHALPRHRPRPRQIRRPPHLATSSPPNFSPLQQTSSSIGSKPKGGGLCFIAGDQFNPEHYRQTPLEVLLPVTPDEIDPRARLMPPADNSPFGILLTPAGKETNLFRFFDDPDESWKQVANLPDMYWFKPVQGLKPGAIVLAMNPKRTTGGTPAPLLVMRQYGAGPVLFSGLLRHLAAGAATPASLSSKATGCNSAASSTPTKPSANPSVSTSPPKPPR